MDNDMYIYIYIHMQTNPSIFSKKNFIDEDGSDKIGHSWHETSWNHVEPSIFKVNNLED